MWPFGRKPKTEARDVQFSPELSVWLATQSRTALAAAGIAVTPDSAMRMMAVFACVQVIAEDLASLPLKTYRRLARGKAEAFDHALYPLLHDAPNPEMTSFQFRHAMQSSILLTGNGIAEIVVENGWPAALWPIPSSRVQLRRNTQTERVSYHVNPPMGPPATLPPERVFHLRDYAPDGVWGISRIGLARNAIGLGMAAEEFASGFFARGARPSLVAEYPGQLSIEAHTRLRAELEDTLGGLNNAQRIALLEEGMKMSAIQVSPEDAQFIDQRKFSVLEIARLFRVQPHKMAVLEGTQSYASVEQANIDHVVSTIRPWAVRWEQQIALDLIPAEERGEIFAEFLTAGLLRGDHAGRANFYRTLWNIGALSTNDIRELENLNPVEGGDTYYVPVNVMPAGSTPVEQAQRARLMLLMGGDVETREEIHASA